MKQFGIFLMVTVIMLFMAGCGTKTEIEKLGIVQAMGIDMTPDGKYLVSLQLLKPQKQSSGGSGSQKSGTEKPPTDVEFISIPGETIYSALDNLSTEFGKKINLSHIQVVVIGEEAARSGVTGIIDTGIRSHQFRVNTPILIAKEKATKIISAVPSQDLIPANTIKNILEQQSRFGYSAVITYLDFANTLASKTTSPMAGVIDCQRTEQGDSFKIAGTAIFNKDKLIGYMDAEETRGIHWIKGKVKDGNIVIPAPGEGHVTVRVTHVSSIIKPVMFNNKPVIQATVNLEGYIREMTGKLDPIKKPELLKELDEIQNEAIKKEIDKTLYAAQKIFKADIFEFGEMIHRDYPDEWRSMKKNWNEIFPDLVIEITVNSQIQRPGIISKPLE